ncbi:OmpA family protein [Marinimicrobium locisalis]|uniref:OmpA family protein n=1 Tax=Marinimicrobium locisalis TaxID=546022 RepID=UPI0032216DB4
MKRLLAMCAVLAIAACTTTDPYTGEKKTSNTAKGAGIGAVAGAVIGAASASKSDRKKGALTGAAAGAAIGGGVGNYMDRQEAKLRDELQGSGVQVRREGDRLYLIMPGNITFATGRYEIRSEFYSVLDSVSKVLKEFDKTAIKVSGHTDSTGSDELNQRLSEQRAESVRQYLIRRDVASGRIQAQGYGSRYPVASNSTDQGRQANRRVELELLPMQQ